MRPALTLLTNGVGLLLCGACSFSFSVGGLDYELLESTIADDLTEAYAQVEAVTVDDVSCPRLAETPSAGEVFVCNAAVADGTIRVEVTVTDDDLGVTYETLDLVYDIATVEQQLAADVGTQAGTDVTVTCAGERIRIVPISGSFECSGTDPAGAIATIRVQADGIGDTSWEITATTSAPNQDPPPEQEEGVSGSGLVLDTPALEAAILADLETAYAAGGKFAVGAVDCPPQATTPAIGDSFVCEAQVADGVVRVEATVTSDALDVTYQTLDLVYDIGEVEQRIAADASAQAGVAVTVTCPGPRTRIVAIGSSFDCTAADAAGQDATIRVTADGIDSTSWVVV